VEATAKLLGVREEEIFRVSAKTGEGVGELLEEVAKKVPPPKEYSPDGNRALIFDSLYDDHKGILAFVRVFDGEFRAGEEIKLFAAGMKLKAKEVGYFSPELKAAPAITAGGMGYIATGLKEPALVKIGDTVLGVDDKQQATTLPLPGYNEPSPVVFISFYPDGATKFEDLKKGLERLRLTDAALSFEPDANEALGRGLKVGFLGQLHFEITASRLKREFGLEFLTSFPSIAYRVLDDGKDFIVRQPQDFPDKPEKVWQPMIKLTILAPSEYLNQVVNLKNIFELEIKEIKNIGENLMIAARMPLAELIRDFDDRLKSVSAGYASFSYELDGEGEADVLRLEILIAGDALPALTRIVPRKDLEHEARSTVERLKKLLPKQQFAQAIQAKANGRIIARETIPAMRKDVTGYLYGGDRSRKMKLWKKQQRGKEKLQSMAKVNITPEIFREILKK
jgi:GTP-binding protein LepA